MSMTVVSNLTEVRTRRPSAWATLTCSLLQQVQDAGIFRYSPDREMVRGEIAAALEYLADDAGDAEMASATNRLLPMLQQLFGSVEEAVNSSFDQMLQMVRALVDGLNRVPSDSYVLASSLYDAVDRLDSTAGPGDVAAAREELESPLRELLARLAERETNSAALVRSLQDRVHILEEMLSSSQAAAANLSRNAPPSAGSDRLVDKLTGLKGMEYAERTIMRLSAHAPSVVVRAFYIQGLEYFNARFGSRVADELLCLAAQYVASRFIGPQDRLYRWRGPAFVAIIDEKTDPPAGSDRIHRIQFDLSGGAILASVGIATRTFALKADGGPELLQNVEQFILSPDTRAAA